MEFQEEKRSVFKDVQFHTQTPSSDSYFICNFYKCLLYFLLTLIITSFYSRLLQHTVIQSVLLTVRIQNKHLYTLYTIINTIQWRWHFFNSEQIKTPCLTLSQIKTITFAKATAKPAWGQLVPKFRICNYINILKVIYIKKKKKKN